MKLLYSPTPNGWKATIMLEELRERGYPLEGLETQLINLMEGEQFSEDFTRHNPNQKIPVLIDGDRSILESGAILHYLAEKYPSSLLPEGERKWDVLPWLYWQMGNLGPVFGNKLSYTRYIDIDEAMKAHPLERFGKEALRLASVLESQLEKHDWITSDDFTIADIAIYPWIRGYKWSKVDITGHERLMDWVARVRARPGVERGIAYGVPKDEIDSWSQERRKAYQNSGSTIADNANIKTVL